MTNDRSKSVWLSGTSSGSFRLTADQNNQQVDSWTRTKPGLRVSVSPVVSSALGGTATNSAHTLSDDSGCVLDAQLQSTQGGSGVLPPHLTLPTLPWQTLPALALPPIAVVLPAFGRPAAIGVMPTLPGTIGVTPTVPGTVGVMPTVPGAIGVTPTVPGTVGVMPTVPGAIGVTPTVPGTVGVMPTVPGAIGVTPTVPGTVGVMPTVPGAIGVTPTVPGTEGVMPTVPGAVGVTPTVPGTVAVVPAVASPAETVIVVNGQFMAFDPLTGRYVNCPDPLMPARAGQARPECPDRRSAANATVPLTPGRDFGVSTEWNVWTDFRVNTLADNRFSQELSGTSTTAAAGIDKKIQTNAVVGLMLTYETTAATGYGQLYTSTTNGLSIGPYVAVMLSPNWAIDASVSFGQFSNGLGLGPLEASYQSQRYTGSASIHAQYEIEGFEIRPKLQATFAHTNTSGYTMTGLFFGQSVQVPFDSSSYDYGSAEFTTELGRVFSFADGTKLQPYGKFGLQYDFERPNGGQVLSSDLVLMSPSAWMGSARAGFRALLPHAIQVDASGGYLSLGQPGLDIWEARLRLSFSF